MNNYCRNCGKKLDNQIKCEICNTKVLTARVGELNKTLAKRYINIFFLLIAVIVFCIYRTSSTIDFNEIFDSIMKWTIFGLILFVIYAKKRLKYSKFFNFVFWLMLFFLIAAALFILFVLISCEYNF